MRKNTDLKDDALQLAKRDLAADAETEVWEMLDRAVTGLDNATQEILTEYLNGTTFEQLSVKRGLKKQEVELWITRAKRELIKRLRTECMVRQ
jgi:DNA-directed RNA polymerase specialized sigma24 family protein